MSTHTNKLGLYNDDKYSEERGKLGTVAEERVISFLQNEFGLNIKKHPKGKYKEDSKLYICEDLNAILEIDIKFTWKDKSFPFDKINFSRRRTIRENCNCWQFSVNRSLSRAILYSHDKIKNFKIESEGNWFFRAIPKDLAHEFILSPIKDFDITKFLNIITLNKGEKNNMNTNAVDNKTRNIKKFKKSNRISYYISNYKKPFCELISDRKNVKNKIYKKNYNEIKEKVNDKTLLDLICDDWSPVYFKFEDDKKNLINKIKSTNDYSEKQKLQSQLPKLSSAQLADICMTRKYGIRDFSKIRSKLIGLQHHTPKIKEGDVPVLIDQLRSQKDNINLNEYFSKALEKYSENQKQTLTSNTSVNDIVTDKSFEKKSNTLDEFQDHIEPSKHVITYGKAKLEIDEKTGPKYIANILKELASR